MNKLEKPQKVQEDKYSFPYHYIPSFHNNNFKQSYNIKWGYEYVSYINFVISLLNNMSFSSLIDIGCGDGRFINRLNKSMVNKNLLGVDYSERAIKLANALNPGLDFICADITKDYYKEKKDVVTLIETLEHLPLDKINTFIESINNLINNNGYLVLTVPSDNEKVDSHHYQHFNETLIKQYFKQYFKIETIFYINKISKNVSRMSKLLTNKYFILNNRYLLNKIYKFYIDKFFIAKASNSRRICAVLKKL